MFDRFSSPSRQAVKAARIDVQRRGHAVIRSEHLLFSYLKFAPMTLSATLARHNIHLDPIGRTVALLKPDEQVKVDTTQLAFSQNARLVLECALECTSRLGHCEIGLEHLVLGILRTPKSRAFAILQETGSSLESIQQSLLEDLGTSGDISLLQNQPFDPNDQSDKRHASVQGHAALSFAKKYAADLNHRGVSSAHLLIGVCQIRNSLAYQAFRETFLGFLYLQRELETLLNAKPPVPASSQSSATQELGAVLQHAQRQAAEDECGEPDPQHYLRAMIDVEFCTAHEAFLNLSVDLKALRKRLD